MIRTFCILTVANLVAFTECVLEGKIVGGENANITDFPYSALLAIKCKIENRIEEGSWTCGASIVNQELLLTAAHCLFECLPNSWVLVSVGHVHMNKGYKNTVCSFLVHEEFNYYTERNDIAMVKLKNALSFNSSVSRVALMKHPPYNEKAKVAGWGMIDEIYRVVRPYLKAIDQYVLDKWDCINMMKDELKGMFCASSDKHDDYAASGDSGSPLVVRGYIQIGIVAFKKPIINTSVIIYTDTGYFYDWIAKNAGLALDCC